MNIKEAEQQSGVSRRNIRFYEQKGLLTPERNQENDYREYSEDEIRALKLIRALRMLDMPLEQVREVLTGQTPLQNAVSSHKITLKKRIKELETAMRFCDELTTTAEPDIDHVLCRMDEPEHREKLSKRGDRDYANEAIGILLPLLVGFVPCGVGAITGVLTIIFFSEIPALGYCVSIVAYTLWAGVGFHIRKFGHWFTNALLLHTIPLVSCLCYLWMLTCDWNIGGGDIIAIFGYLPILFTGTPLTYLIGAIEHMTWVPLALLAFAFCLGGVCGWIWDYCRTNKPETATA